jgi:hypothetical protein
MRARTFALVAVSTALAAITLPVSSASATDSSLIVRSVPAAGIGATAIKPMNYNCGTGSAGTGSAVTVTSAGAPSGAGSLRLAVGSNADTETGLYKNYASPLPAASLTALSFNIAGVSDNDPYFLDIYFDRDGAGSGTAQDLLELVIPNNSSWQAVDALTTGYDVYLDENTGSTPDSTGTTMAQYLTNHSSAGIFGWYITNYCSAIANQVVYLDTLKVGDNAADAVTYDFEPATTITATGGTAIVAGATRTITGTLKNGTAAVPGVALDVLAKTYPASTFTKIGTTAATNSSGVATFNVKPTKQTSYEFRVADAGASHGAATSGATTVTVKTAITRNVYDTSVTTTQTILAYGLTTPAKPGTIVYLYRGSTSFASARVASDGTYLLQGRIGTKGSYSVTVRGAAGSGNIAGISAPVTVTVS